MTQPPIDATRFVLRGLRLLRNACRAAEATWERVTAEGPDAAPRDRRRPPQIW